MGKRTKVLLVKALKPTLSVTWLVIAFCSMTSIFSQLYAETVDPLKYESYFLWAGVKPQPILENAEIIYIHGGEVWMNDNTQIIDMRAGVPRINHADIWPVTPYVLTMNDRGLAKTGIVWLPDS